MNLQFVLRSVWSATMLGACVAIAAPLPHASAPASAPTAAAAKAASAAPRVSPANLVDINSASAAELKKLPGITQVEAAKIIAGRPYGSKAQLVSRQVVDANQYQVLKNLVQAKQPFKDAAKNAAVQAKSASAPAAPSPAPSAAKKPLLPPATKASS